MSSQSLGKRRATTSQAIPIKRFRVSRACDQCRQAREKCDGNPPVCSPCLDGKRDCTFTSNPKKRGLPPGYIRTIELALAIIFQQNEDLETFLTSKLSQQTSTLISRDTTESSRLHKSWRKSRFRKNLNKALAGEPVDDDDAKDTTSDQDSDPSAQDPVVSQPQPELIPTQEQPARPALFASPFTNMEPPPLRCHLSQLPPDCWRLLDIYFTYIQCWLPICEKLDVLKLSYSYPEHGLNLHSTMDNSGSHAEMWSVLAVAALQDQPDSLADARSDSRKNAERFYLQSRSLLPEEKGQFQLGHIKALLNLAIYNVSNSLPKAAWLLVGTASRLSSLQRQPANAPDPRQKHVAASCFVLDVLLAVQLNQRPNVSGSEVAKQGKINEDTLEEWQPWEGDVKNSALHQSRTPLLALSNFNKLVGVVDILSEKFSQTDHDAAFQAYLAQRLERWESTLPPQLNYVKSAMVAFRPDPSAFLLRLTYQSTAFMINNSQHQLEQIINTVNTASSQLGLARLPSVLICLLEGVVRISSRSIADQNIISKVRSVLIGAHATFSNHGSAYQDQLHGPVAPMSSSPANTQLQNTILIPVSPESSSRTDRRSPLNTKARSYVPSLLEDLLPDMNSNQQSLAHQPSSFDPPENSFHTLDHPSVDDNAISGELDSFFDELASLHGANKIQNQPQFMQNLGFAPEISMADLLATDPLAIDPGQYLPVAGPSTEAGIVEEPIQFSLNDYYNAS